MKSQGVVGKRIRAIRQSRVFNENIGRMTNVVGGIELEDGTILIPSVEEFEGDYGVDFLVVKPRTTPDTRCVADRGDGTHCQHPIADHKNGVCRRPGCGCNAYKSMEQWADVDSEEGRNAELDEAEEDDGGEAAHDLAQDAAASTFYGDGPRPETGYDDEPATAADIARDDTDAARMNAEVDEILGEGGANKRRRARTTR